MRTGEKAHGGFSFALMRVASPHWTPKRDAGDSASRQPVLALGIDPIRASAQERTRISTSRTPELAALDRNGLRRIGLRHAACEFRCFTDKCGWLCVVSTMRYEGRVSKFP